MRTKSIPSTWIYREKHRLDCGPYMSGALEARIILEALPIVKTPLGELTKGHAGGIYNGPIFRRNYVSSREHGVPFLTSSSMLLADLSNVGLLRKKDARSKKLSYLELKQGMTMISCSGSIGRMVYVRPEMEGMWSSQDNLKVVPDPAKIPPGYVYAFLSSKFGVPQVVSGTYGAIIQHIEPEHIANLPVPRLGEKIERQVHNLVQQAAEKRSEAARIICDAENRLAQLLKLQPLKYKTVSQFSTEVVPSKLLCGRLDAPFYCSAAIELKQSLENSRVPVAELRDVVGRLFKPPMFKRLWVEDPEFGTTFISGIDAYRLSNINPRYVSRKTPNYREFILEKGTVIFQAAGQIYGLFGRPLLVWDWLEGTFCADDMYRIVPNRVEDGAFLYLYLRSEFGEVEIKRQASGNSIPRVWDPQMNQVKVPWPEEQERDSLAALVMKAHELMAEARVAESRGVEIVEDTVEGAD